MGIEVETVRPTRRPEVGVGGAEEEAEDDAGHGGAQRELGDALLARDGRCGCGHGQPPDGPDHIARRKARILPP